MARTKSIELVVNDEEKREIETAAKRAGVSVASFLRMVGLDAARKAMSKQRQAA